MRPDIERLDVSAMPWTPLDEHDHACIPPRTVRGRLSSPGGDLAYINFGGPITFQAR